MSIGPNEQALSLAKRSTGLHGILIEDYIYIQLNVCYISNIKKLVFNNKLIILNLRQNLNKFWQNLK